MTNPSIEQQQATMAPGRARRSPMPELLSPAGGPEPFAAALAAGADAIYCGMGDFNARRKAENFDDESFAQACRTAHILGSRVYVTVNIVIKQAELPSALELIRRCSELGADAFIIQDWGLFALVRALMPQIETHISTQANIHDARGAAWCRDRGADRVTLSRELSLDEVAQIAPMGVDLEVFAHGSICFSYSGVCLLSSFACSGRSANRGMCAQPCRLPYTLIDERGRALSTPERARALCPRDTNTLELLSRLISAGASALKLEGRMKAPDYVYAVTDAYRQQLDDLAQGAEPSPAKTELRERQLKRCFNRDFTHAYQTGTSGDEMMSYERSNNRGQVVGTVVGFIARAPRNRSERFRERDKGPQGRAVIRLDEPVGKGDLLELRHDDEPEKFLTGIVRADADAGDQIELDVPRFMPNGCCVRLIRSQAALDTAEAAVSRPYPRKRSVEVRVTARLGRPFTVELACADDPSIRAVVDGFTVEAARTKPVTEDDLIEHVGRMGSSPFEPASFTVDLDEGCGMGFSAVHRVRAAACDALVRAILAPFEARSRRARAVELPTAPDAIVASAGLACPPDRETPREHVYQVCALASTIDAAEAALEAGADLVYMTTDALDAAGIGPDEAAEHGIVPVLDEVCRHRDHARTDPWILPGAPVAIGNISELALASEQGADAQIRSCIPVHNTAAIAFLEREGARGFWLSPELTLDEISLIAPAAHAPVGLMILGRPRVMTSEHCILQVSGACIHDCARCALRSKSLALKNIDGKILPVRTDLEGRSRLYAGDMLDLTPQIPQLIRAGVTRFLIDGTLAGDQELRGHVLRCRRALEAALDGRRPSPRLKGASAGCIFVGVD